jgi:hypothetical protein
MGIETTFTRAQIRGAILAAADSIEHSPAQLCHTHNTRTDWDKHGSGCMLFHVGLQLGMTDEFLTASHVANVCGIGGTDPCNYNELFNFLRTYFSEHFYNVTHSAELTAKGLRAFADARFPAEKLDAAYIAFRSTLSQTMEGAT